MDTAAKRQPEILTPDENHPALNAILGANPFVGIDATQVAGTLTAFLMHLASEPAIVAWRAFQLWFELGQVAAGVSTLAPEAGDKRFADPAWSMHPLYRRMMQTYLAWRAAMLDLASEDESAEWKQAEQHKFAVTLMTEALAPTNAFWLNPAALKRAFDTAGMSLVWGLRQLHRRPVEQRRDALDGGQAAVPGRQKSRALARRRRVPKPASAR